jgi:O-antigen/teichoic acid export membrane protein
MFQLREASAGSAKIQRLQLLRQSVTVMTNKTMIFNLIALVLVALYTPGAYAYLDPSTGSMVVSALVGIFASIALAVKTYWYKLKNLFRRSETSSSPKHPPSDN